MKGLYDYTIVGGGPSGIYSALRLAKLGYTVCLIESLESLGGCHRVRYTDTKSQLSKGSIHTEHGPRVYLGAYIEFWKWIQEIHITRDTHFSEYQFGLLTMENSVRYYVSKFSLGELAHLTIAYCKHCILKIEYSYQYTVDDFMTDTGFSTSGRDRLDKLCRLIDGGNADKTLLGPLLDGIDIGMPYKIYQPNEPMDTLVWDKFHKLLLSHNVSVLLNTNVTKISKGLLITERGQIRSNRIIISCPPYAINKIQGAPELLGYNKHTFHKISSYQTYEPYICFTVEFSKKPAVNSWGIADNHPWGLLIIDMGYYFKAVPGSLFIISITHPYKIDPETHKTANQMGKDEVVDRVVQLVQKRYNIYDEPIRKALSPSVTKVNNEWIDHDQAFMLSPPGWLHPDLRIGDKNKVWTTGHHMGNSLHTYNSMESAIQNAIHLLRRIEPKFTHDSNESWRMSQAIQIIIIVVVISLSYYYRRVLHRFIKKL